jgi:hypothetical protein
MNDLTSIKKTFKLLGICHKSTQTDENFIIQFDHQLIIDNKFPIGKDGQTIKIVFNKDGKFLKIIL